MSARTPAWWYGSGVSLMPTVLEPVALLWRFATWIRWRLVTPYRSKLPVICVGNLTAGGSGKTPTAIALAELLAARGERPVFLTRGHGGSVKGPQLVDPDTDNAEQVGDEALLLAKTAPVVVAADRAEGARLAETRDASVIVMDDGFQNPQLAKDFSILVLDRTTGIGNGQVIPAGPLRAGVASQLKRAQALLLIGDGGAGQDVVNRASTLSLPVLEARVEPAGDTAVRDQSLIAYAGIAHPGKFFRSLEHAGARIVERYTFPDHHMFADADARDLLAAATRAKAVLITTEKDAARLGKGSDALRRLREQSTVFPVTLSFSDTGKVTGLIDATIQAQRKQD